MLLIASFFLGVFAVFVSLFIYFLLIAVEQPEIQQQQAPVVEEYLGEVIGSFQGLKIYEKVRLSDGRIFNYESTAVEYVPGMYYADHIEDDYVVVDHHLLYRELKPA